MLQIREWLHHHLANHKPGEVPPRQLWAETLGFFIVFMGIFIAISLLGYDATDHAKLASGDKNLQNLVGPLGAMMAHSFIRSIGVTSYAWPPALIIWGLLLATGLIPKPRKRRFILFFLLSISAAAVLHVLYPTSEMFYGQGGSIGRFLGGGAQNLIGRVGAILFYVFATITSLIFTRNMSFAFANKAKARKVDLEKEILKAEQIESPSEIDDLEVSAKSSVEKKESVPDQKAKGISLRLDTPSKFPAKPDPTMFKTSSIVVSDTSSDQENATKLTAKLEEFKVYGEIQGVTQGPVVKTFEFEPAAGTKVSKIEALEPDLARLLMTESLRVVPVAGASTVGFEMPNPERKVIPFGNLVNTPDFKSRSIKLPIAMGVDCFGEPVVEDLTEMPHLLVAGSTGSGKSVFINTLITSLLVRNSARDLRMILIDPKMVELGMFNDTAHMACPVVTDIEKDGIPVLNALVDQMELRYKNFNLTGAKNIESFNEIIKNEKKTKYKSFTGKWQPIPYVVVVVDEFADMMMVLGKEAELAIARLAQKARAAGIHLVIATQRPSVQVVTGTIKANFPTRISFRVTSSVDSRTIIDQSGAETLLGNGDMLYLSASGLKRLHAGYMTEDELKKIVKACKKKK